MRAIVNPLHDPEVDALWAEADGLGAPRSKFMRALQRARQGTPPASGGSKFIRAVMRAKQRGGPKAALKIQRVIEQGAKLQPPVSAGKFKQVVMKAKQRGGPKAALRVARALKRGAFQRKKAIIRIRQQEGPEVAQQAAGAWKLRAKKVGRRRRRRVGWQRRRWGRRAQLQRALPAGRARFGFGRRAWRQSAQLQDYGLSGIECDELETLAGLPDDEPYTLGDLGGFFSKIKKTLKKVVKKVVKVTKKVVKSKAFKIAAIGAAAWFAGPLIIGKLAASKGISAAVAKAALKRGAQRLGKTSAVSIGGAAATEATPAPGQAVDYAAIMELGLQPEDQAALRLAPAAVDPSTTRVPGEVGGPRIAGMNPTALVGIVIGGGILTAVMMGGGPRRR